ncbi:hypothetical protein BYT27DRAFT_7122774 [Phlegmacium glaucopus]|nr:hypothetical protein BYT27DRAFT_7122774 [Phlegmacium glaucopus]
MYLRLIFPPEELLIDFRELIGQHSGENMAAAVWSTLETYNIQSKIIAMMMDNASNNDMLMEALESRCHDAGIEFSAAAARMQCMPHTIHLAAIKLLEGIGIMLKSNATQACSNLNYQDDINADLNREHDLNAMAPDEEADDEDITIEAADHVKAAVQKLQKIVRSVCSTPQH